MQAINIGLLGLGTVGSGVVEVVHQNASELSRRLGRDVRIFAVFARNNRLTVFGNKVTEIVNAVNFYK